MPPSEGASARDYVKTHCRSARDLMTTKVVTIDAGATLADIAEMMQRHHIKRVPVVSNGRPVGIVTRGDLLRGVAALLPQSAALSDDETIREQLVNELREQPWAHLIDVQVANGIVQLHGTFQSEDERQALRIALKTSPASKASRTI